MLITLHLKAEDYEPRVINGQRFVPEQVGAMHPIVKAFEKFIDPKYVATLDLSRQELVLIAEDFKSINIPLPGELFTGRSGHFTVAIGDKYGHAFREICREHRGAAKING